MNYAHLPWALAVTVAVVAFLRIKPQQIDELEHPVASVSFGLLCIAVVTWGLTYLWLKVFGAL